MFNLAAQSLQAPQSYRTQRKKKYPRPYVTPWLKAPGWPGTNRKRNCLDRMSPEILLYKAYVLIHRLHWTKYWKVTTDAFSVDGRRSSRGGRRGGRSWWEGTACSADLLALPARSTATESWWMVRMLWACFQGVLLGLWRHQRCSYFLRALFVMICITQAGYQISWDCNCPYFDCNYYNKTHHNKTNEFLHTGDMCSSIFSLAAFLSYSIFLVCLIASSSQDSAMMSPSKSMTEVIDRKEITFFCFHYHRGVVFERNSLAIHYWL